MRQILHILNRGLAFSQAVSLRLKTPLCTGLLLSLILSGFADPQAGTEPSPLPDPKPEAEAAGAFFTRLQQLCDRAFEGRVIKANPGDTLWHESRIVMHVQNCQPELVSIALHVGKDRSRSWLIRYKDSALGLKHEHRSHGESVAVSGYGGSHDPSLSSPTTQVFPADTASLALFRKHGMAGAADSTWWLLFLDSGHFAYRLTRPDREFQINFDLNQPVPPPAP